MLHATGGTLKVPILFVYGCSFADFIGTESLINIQTSNFWKVPRDPSDTSDGKGFLKAMGADTGALITIDSSTI